MTKKPKKPKFCASHNMPDFDLIEAICYAVVKEPNAPPQFEIIVDIPGGLVHRIQVTPKTLTWTSDRHYHGGISTPGQENGS